MMEIILIAVIVLQSVIYHVERRDMLNRIMSKSLTEYKTSGSPPPKHIPSAHDRILKNWRDKAGGN